MVRLIDGLVPDETDPAIVHLWPTEMRQKHLPAIRLRLITIRDGEQTIHLVTDLPAARLPDEQAHAFYRQRWGMEVGFRTLKQTMGHRTMRSRSPERAVMELHWAVVGQTILEAMTVEAQRSSEHASPAEAQTRGPNRHAQRPTTLPEPLAPQRPHASHPRRLYPPSAQDITQLPPQEDANATRPP